RDGTPFALLIFALGIFEREVLSTVKSLIAVIVIGVILSSSSSAFPVNGNSTPEDEGQTQLREIDEAADHFMRRYRETLDLSVVFDEMSVSDQAIRDQNIKQFWADKIGNDKMRGIDNSTLAQIYCKTYDILFIAFEYLLRTSNLEDSADLASAIASSGINELPETKLFHLLGDDTEEISPSELNDGLVTLDQFTSRLRAE